MAVEQYRIWCPFFERENPERHDIICEGVIPGAESRQRFKDDKSMRIWQKRVCCTQECGHRCLIAAALYEYYGGESEARWDLKRCRAGMKTRKRRQ